MTALLALLCLALGVCGGAMWRDAYYARVYGARREKWVAFAGMDLASEPDKTVVVQWADGTVQRVEPSPDPIVVEIPAVGVNQIPPEPIRRPVSGQNGHRGKRGKKGRR